MTYLRNFPGIFADNNNGGSKRVGGLMKSWRFIVALMVITVAVVSVTKIFSYEKSSYVVAEESSSSDDGGSDGEITDFA